MAQVARRLLEDDQVEGEAVAQLPRQVELVRFVMAGCFAVDVLLPLFLPMLQVVAARGRVSAGRSELQHLALSGLS